MLDREKFARKRGKLASSDASPAPPSKLDLSERSQMSIVHLSKYAVQAGKRLADSNGDLKNAKAFQQIAAGRSNLFPKAQPENRVQVDVLSYAATKPDSEHQQST